MGNFGRDMIEFIGAGLFIMAAIMAFITTIVVLSGICFGAFLALRWALS